MKILTAIFILNLMIFGHLSKNEQVFQENCFSEENFLKVYTYIENEISSTGAKYLAFEYYQFYLEKEKKKIFLKKEAYTYAIIDSKNGISSLNKSRQGHERSVKNTHQIFCKLLQLAEKYAG
jgi:hypothetical protein